MGWIDGIGILLVLLLVYRAGMWHGCDMEQRRFAAERKMWEWGLKTPDRGYLKFRNGNTFYFN